MSFLPHFQLVLFECSINTYLEMGSSMSFCMKSIWINNFLRELAEWGLEEKHSQGELCFGFKKTSHLPYKYSQRTIVASYAFILLLLLLLFRKSTPPRTPPQLTFTNWRSRINLPKFLALNFYCAHIILIHAWITVKCGCFSCWNAM